MSASEGPPLTADVLGIKARKATLSASKLLEQLLGTKSRIELSLLRSGERYDSFRQTFERLTFAKKAPATDRWPAASSFEEEGVLHGLDKFEMLLDAIPRDACERSSDAALSRTLKNGQFCDRVIEEIRKIRHLYPASTMVQIRTAHPEFLVWSLIDDSSTDEEDRDVFRHPNRWGPVVGYAVKLLARHYGKSEDTIQRWRKACRKYAKQSS